MAYAFFKASLDTCLDNLLLANLSVHGLHFTVYAPSSNTAVDDTCRGTQPRRPFELGQV